jgi:hypothetical protein
MSKKPWLFVAIALAAMVVLISGCGSSAPGAGNTAGNAHTALQFAQCMRKDGVSNFPDPTATGEFTIDQVANGSSLDTNTPAFIQALSACKQLEPAGFTGSKRSAQEQAAALKFAGCVRHNGVKDFPDPTPTGALVDTNRIPSAAQPGGMSALRSAMKKCSGVAALAGVTR